MKASGSINESIVRKILIYIMLIIVSSISIILIINYFVVKRNTEIVVEKDLKANVDTLYAAIDNSYDDFKIKLMDLASTNKIVFYDLYRNNPGTAKSRMKNILSKQKIGQSGYFYVHDSRGILSVHLKPEMINKDVSNLPFVQETIKKKNGFIEYKWANPGEKLKRSKAIGFSYIPELDWYICASAYTEEFADKHNQNSQDKTADYQSIKDRIRKLKIGKEGYAYIQSSEGILLVHPKSEGKSVFNFDFTQYILKQKNGTYSYYWEGRKKIMGFRYFEPLDWYLVATSYYEEFLNEPMNIVLYVSISMIVILSGIMFFIIILLLKTIIVKPINQARGIAQSITQGDLTIEISEVRHDEMGLMISAISEMIQTQRSIISDIFLKVTKLSSSSQEMKQVSGKISGLSQEQAASMEQTSAALEEMLASMEQIVYRTKDQFDNVGINADRMGKMSENAQHSYDESMQVSKLMASTADKAKIGESDLNKMVNEMKNIKESTQKIAEIIMIISDISDQVNLLSLNAAIEAARAGDHGRGFAVVADEISKLADQTASSAKSITSLVHQGNSRVDEGTSIVDRTAFAFHEIIVMIEQLTKGVTNFSETLKLLAQTASEAQQSTNNIKNISNEISQSTQEQMTTNKEVSVTIERVNEASQQLVTYAESILNISELVGSMSGDLQERLKRYKF